jgi:hypothetical protein
MGTGGLFVMAGAGPPSAPFSATPFSERAKGVDAGLRRHDGAALAGDSVSKPVGIRIRVA